MRALGDRDYRGEVYVTRGRARVLIDAYTPGRIAIRCDAAAPSTFIVNANYLAGWVVVSGQASAGPSGEGLIEVTVPPGQQSIVLAYRPSYWYPVVAAYMCGAGLLIVLAMKRKGLLNEHRELS